MLQTRYELFERVVGTPELAQKIVASELDMPAGSVRGYWSRVKSKLLAEYKRMERNPGAEGGVGGG